jgi:hypothetical protein
VTKYGAGIKKCVVFSLLKLVELELRAILLVLLFKRSANGFLAAGSGTTKYSHHAETKHSTQSYTNNKGHHTYNAKEKN